MDAMDVSHVIDVRNLSKRYGDRTVLDAVDVRVAPGETVGVLGPNGAGKTTLVEILEGHRRLDHGSVSVLGASPHRAPPSWRARIGVVTQESGAFDRLTPREIIGHLARWYPDPVAPAVLIDQLDLDDFADRRIDRLSGGQRRRVDVACGLVGRPDLLFLDEPTTGLDPEARHRLWDVIRSLQGQGTTIILTTHYLDEVESLADQVVVLAAGRIVATGTPSELGRGDAAVDVSFDAGAFDGDALESVASRSGASLRIEGSTAILRTHRPTALIARLYASQRGPRRIEIPGLAIARPSLENVYLEMLAADAGGPVDAESPALLEVAS